MVRRRSEALKREQDANERRVRGYDMDRVKIQKRINDENKGEINSTKYLSCLLRLHT
jgi:hypothetical protein